MKRKKKMPKSLRKYIRTEKARIRREVLDSKEQKEAIGKIYSELFSGGKPVSVNPDNRKQKTKKLKKDKPKQGSSLKNKRTQKSK